MSTIYDVIIIGSGAGGGTLARHLAPSGKRILLLERGGWLPREPENWMAEEVFVKNRYVSTETWYDRHGEPFQPGVHYFVGGATKMYGAALYRLRREDFGEIRHYDGVSPAWPLAYEEMEPYYTKAEQMYHVHGARGEDPTEPPASAPYPHPAVSHEPRMQRLHDDLARAGYRPFHAPCGIMLDEKRMPFSRCIRCKDCDGFPCLVHAKSDAEVLAVRPAIEYPTVTLLTRALGRPLNTNAARTAVTHIVGERGRARPRLDTAQGGRARRRFLALDRAPALARQPDHAGQGRSHSAQLHSQQPGAQAEALRQAPLDARPPRPARAPHPTQPVHEERDRGRRRGASGGYLSLRGRPRDVRPGHALQGPRAGQPVRGRHQLLPEHRRREPGTDRDGERAARR